ncbi:MAG: alpha-galactosidase [Blastocatellia bacterium]|jgi:alpha-galactosidase|nr:alpha-galactosidase [Blastocatellia bacterium]
MKMNNHAKMKFFWKLSLCLCASVAICLSAGEARALDNGLAKTPPMGWNSWNKFACDVSEQLIREAADALVTSGMKDAGYQYIVIDDCWQIERDAQGNIIPDPKRFPNGMKAIADYVHSKGLKFGVYSDAGTLTCQKRPGSRGYEFQDARQYASWGVDYLKYDWCSTSTQNQQASYSIMRDALLKAGRPIVFSICEWGSSKPWLWARDVGNLWRTTGDIQDCWDCKRDWGGMGFVHILDLQDGLEAYSGPGHWNDPDMLEVGNGGMTTAEYRAHFSLWCILAAPLMAGNDIRSMPPEIAEILTNKELIAVDQDAMGLQGRRVKREGELDVWARQLADGSRAVALLNRGTAESKMSVNWNELGYPNNLSATVRDLWTKKDLGRHTGSFTASVPSHGVVVVKIKP